MNLPVIAALVLIALLVGYLYYTPTPEKVDRLAGVFESVIHKPGKPIRDRIPPGDQLEGHR